MTTSTALGRAASCLESFAAGLCLTLVASAFLFAAEAHAQAAPAPAPAAPVVRAQGDGPALWVVRDADSTIYLFGTVHMLKPGTAWGSDKVDAAFDSASEIWFEVTNPDDQSALLPIIQQHGVSRDGPLSAKLTEAERTRLAQALQGTGMSPAQVDPMRPWFVALMIGLTPLTDAGFDTQAGVELNLRARALAAGKTVKGLETLEQQLGGLAGMSDEGQLIYLRHYLAHYDEAASDLERAVAGWAAGDDDAMDVFARETGRGVSEETHQVFLARRNADWANQLQTLLAGSGTAFVAVGAAHLAGDDSVQELLAEKGIVATRL